MDPYDTLTAGVVRSTTAATLRRLVQVYGPGGAAFRPRAVPLDARRLTLGRSEPAICVVDDARASRRHAEISYVTEYGVHRLEDLGSKNGTFLNGRRLEGHAEHLHDGAVLGVGESLFVYEAYERPGAVTPERLDDCPLDVSLARYAAEVLVDRAASTALPVLIRGPTGAGKEALARRVHEASGRTGPLVSVNCPAFTRELLGSELFGHVQGAYSGAQSERRGLVQAASGGTLFLDEFAEMPLEQQPALLRALQEQKSRPVGSDADIDVDVRVVAATHQDVDRLEQEGRLRSDLLARLAGLVVHLPGLRTRKVEVLPLFRTLLGAPDAELTPDAAERLLTYDWPKNVRELKRFADTVQLFLEGRVVVDASMLPGALRPTSPQPGAAAPESRRKELERLLEAHEGNVARVAKAIGEHRQQVYRWLKAYGLEAEAFRRRKK